ncbi:MAG: flagellar motor protein MotB [Gammaproteobacteria bacterium]
MANDNQPIIIKKIKKGGHGHHGGAWKVAFADFVTAMMAFFMLMWLLGSTTPEQKAAISDYFNNPSAVPGPGGASTSMIKNGGEMDVPKGEGESPLQQSKPTEVEQEVDVESEQTKATLAELESAESEDRDRKQELDRMESMVEELKKSMAAGQALEPFKDQLLIDITSEGLRIQIVDKENRPMFDSGSSTLKSYTQIILKEVAKVIAKSPNRISLSGHTDRTPFLGRNGYSNWELSADRANAARRALTDAGVAQEKIGRVVGLSDSVLFDKKNPFNPINRRISIVVMNKATEKAMSQGESAAVDTKSNTSKSATPAVNSKPQQNPAPAMVKPSAPAENSDTAAPVAKPMAPATKPDLNAPAAKPAAPAKEPEASGNVVPEDNTIDADSSPIAQPKPAQPERSGSSAAKPKIKLPIDLPSEDDT